MKIINKLSKWGKSKQTPKKFVIHAMGESINLDSPVELKNKSGNVYRTISPGVYHATDWLQELRLSAHYLVGQEDVAWRCRYPDQGGFHAGGHNKDSVGFELLIPKAYNLSILKNRMNSGHCYSYNQYDFVAEQIVQISKDHGIRGVEENIFGHDELSPDRKSDPGMYFDYEKLYALIRQYAYKYGYDID